MRVENIECQIAKSQIVRYVSGESLSPDTLRQLEEHVAECAGCQAMIEERKRSLVAMLGQKPKPAVETPHYEELEPEVKSTPSKRVPTRPAPPAPERDGKTARMAFADVVRAKLAENPPTQAVVEAPEPTEPTRAKPARPNTVKPVLYSVALAAVLISMSYLAKDPTRLLGDRVTASAKSPAPEPEKPKAAAPKVEVTVPEVNRTSPIPSAPVPQPKNSVGALPGQGTATPKGEIAIPDAGRPASPETPKASVRKPRRALGAATTRRSVNRSRVNRTKLRGRTRVKKSTSAPRNAVRIYDANGKPIS